ncbi:transposase [Salicibibacter cibarius]|uniref:Transposase n=1 Tax=Salicibibacter cibarius TaxID=2743000 RepID=A0A7T7CBF3_9BACI|nr:transposase [Salicibibacter cibarius]
MRAELVVRLVVLDYFFDHSERELFHLLPMHAGYLWFCGLDFESSLPDRTTLGDIMVFLNKSWCMWSINA